MNKYDIKYIFKRVVIFFIIFIIMSFVKSCKVNAAELPYWSQDIKQFKTYFLADLTSSSYSLPSLSYQQFETPDGSIIPYYVNSSAVSIASNGIMPIFTIDEKLMSGYVYAINFYYCGGQRISWNNTNVSIFGGWDISSTASRNNYFTYSNSNLTDINGLASSGSGVFSYCTMSTSIVVPNNLLTYVGVRLTAKSSTISNVYLNAIGYDIKEIGIYSEEIRSILNNVVSNSGLASASSVQQVQTSVNQIQNELSNVDSSIQDQTEQQHQDHQETMNTITNDNVDGASSEVDSLLENEAFNDSSGIQSIINAPLNFINSLTNSCSPISITIPYIDTDLTIPCIKQELTNHVPTLVPILSTAINGFVIYRILLDIVYLIKSSRNPDDDRIEVLDL